MNNKSRFFSRAAIASSLIILVSSCSYFDEKGGQLLDHNVSTTKSIIEVKSDAEELEVFTITQDMALYYAKSIKDRPDVISIDTFDYHGVACLYIINYKQGWIAIPTDSRAGVSLGESQKEQLFLKDDLKNGIRVWLEITAEHVFNIIKSESEEYDENSVFLWQKIKNATDSSSTKSLEPEGPTWVRQTVSVSTTTQDTHTVDHLLSTAWGQGSPWNCTLPTDPAAQSGDTTHFLTGCVPTAISQILYYFHNNTGYPRDFWHSMIPSVVGQDGYGRYTIALSKNNYVSNSSRWSSMPETINDSGVFQYVSDLMMDVGYRINAKYSTNNNTIVNSVLVSPSQNDLIPCGLSAQIGSYNYTTVRNNLMNSKPVFIAAHKLNNQGEIGDGHAWVIDGVVDRAISTATNYVYYVYQEGVLYPTGSEYLSDSDVLPYYPNAYDGMSVVETTNTYSHFLLMNFGYDGQYLDSLFSIEESGSNWISYDYQKFIYYNISAGQLN